MPASFDVHQSMIASALYNAGILNIKPPIMQMETITSPTISHVTLGRGVLYGKQLGMVHRDHAKLQQYLRDVEDTCTQLNSLQGCRHCSTNRQAVCQGRISSFLFDLIDITNRHFLHEELLMAEAADKIDDTTRQAHHLAHANITHAINELYAQSAKSAEQGRYHETYQRLYMTLTELFSEHEQMFDRKLLALLG